VVGVAKVATKAPQAKPKPSDFSHEYKGCQVTIETSIGVTITGSMVEASRYWFKVRTANGLVYVNKAHVVTVTPAPTCRGV
jgi:hypothetical protein